MGEEGEEDVKRDRGMEKNHSGRMKNKVGVAAGEMAARTHCSLDTFNSRSFYFKNFKLLLMKKIAC